MGFVWFFGGGFGVVFVCLLLLGFVLCGVFLGGGERESTDTGNYKSTVNK